MSEPSLLRNHRVLDRKGSHLSCGMCNVGSNFSTGSLIMTSCRILKRIFSPHDSCSLNQAQFDALFGESKEEGGKSLINGKSSREVK